MRSAVWQCWKIVCLWLPLGWAFAQSDPMELRITYDKPAQTVKQLLEDLSRQTDVRFHVQPPLDAEIVLVVVREMPLKELMAHLATVTDAEWIRQSDGSHRLVRTPKILHERRKQDNAELLRALKRQLEQAETLQLAAPLTESQARQLRNKIKELMREIENANPTTPLWKTPYYNSLYTNSQELLAGVRLLVRLLQKMNLQHLLEIPVGERRVFSNVQGKYLTPLGFSAEPLMQQFLQEQEIVYQVWAHPTEGISPEKLNEFEERFGVGVFQEWHSRKPSRHTPKRIYVEIRRHSPEYFSFSVVLATDDGKQLLSEDGSSWFLFAKRDNQERLSAQNSSHPQIEIVWSERTREFLEAYRTMERTEEAVPWPAILNPSQTEPLSLVPTDVLCALARARGKSLVALLGDDLASGMSKRALRGGRFFEEYRPTIEWIAAIQESESVILCKPRYSSYRWGQRANRVALMQAIERLRQHGYPRLEAIVSLNQFVMQSISNAVAELYLQLIIPEDVWFYLAEELFFLASLTPVQMERLWAGQALSLADLTPAQREQLTRMLYVGSNYHLRISRRSPNPSEESEGGEFLRSVGLIHALYPNGLPADTTIQQQEGFFQRWELGVFTQRRAGVWSSFQTLSGIVDAIYSVQADEQPQWMSDYMREVYRERVARYQTQLLMPARMRMLALEVRLDKHLSVPLLPDLLIDYELLNEGKPATLDKLPEDFKKQLKEIEESFKKWRRHSPDQD
ncbi:MAG: hypothetical protein CFK49_06665 [Armatimonadetes bacterium JP3_11]|nr:MAG: hypothetical protein CFK49_06665 [Armatimonadetes bacterium JP3_11]RMH10627.1 MAG: hypothetical protein D6697_00585 [Armatimonadota bacterium]